MFYVYVLRSQKTGRRYVRSCENLDDRLRRHNAGESKATKHGIPWTLLHSEGFLTRPEAVTKERYYKTGRGRDELDRLDLERSPRRLTPTMSGNKEMTLIRLVILAAIGGATLTLSAQEAAGPDVDLTSKRNEQNPTPSNPSAVPELSQLDEIFKQTSLGKTADAYRLHTEGRKLHNQVVNDPEVVAAKKAAESSRTDLEKRQRLRDYYNIYYERMKARAESPEMKIALDASKAAHLTLLNQSRVRPSPAPAPAPAASPVPSPADENEH